MSPETREKIRQKLLGHPVSKQTREKLRRAATNPSPEVREKIRAARLRQILPKKMTSIEQLLYHEFKKRRLKFKMHKTMFNRWQPDFVFESAKLIVQADGDYWHNLPSYKIRDAAFNETAHLEGWAVWRFGERQIKMHAASCGRAVARFVKDHARPQPP